MPRIGPGVSTRIDRCSVVGGDGQFVLLDVSQVIDLLQSSAFRKIVGIGVNHRQSEGNIVIQARVGFDLIEHRHETTLVEIRCFGRTRVAFALKPEEAGDHVGISRRGDGGQLGLQGSSLSGVEEIRLVVGLRARSVPKLQPIPRVIAVNHHYIVVGRIGH